MSASSSLIESTYFSPSTFDAGVFGDAEMAGLAAAGF
jgi:hypothetical protein